MATLNRASILGTLIGLAVGLAVLVFVWNIEPANDSTTAFLQFLIAAPPFLIGGLPKAPAAVQAVVVVVWWGVAGAAFGWGLGRGPRGKVLTALASVVLIFAHLFTQAAIERNVSAAAHAMEGLLLALFGY